MASALLKIGICSAPFRDFPRSVAQIEFLEWTEGDRL